MQLVFDPHPVRQSRFETRLTSEQLESLRACERGISLRFEQPEIVNALITAGYAEKNIAGVVTVTALGQEYLREYGY
jgi:hypothetical protein